MLNLKPRPFLLSTLFFLWVQSLSIFGCATSNPIQKDSSPDPSPSSISIPSLEVPLATPQEMKVEEIYQSYRKQLLETHRDLEEKISFLSDPALGERLRIIQEDIKVFGFGSIPKIVDDDKSKKSEVVSAKGSMGEYLKPPASRAYSWVHTENAIVAENPKLQEFKKVFEKAKKGDTSCNDSCLIDKYKVLKESERLLDQHVNYNKGWQPQIPKYLEFFKERTKLYFQVFELHRIALALHAKTEREFWEKAFSVTEVTRGESRSARTRELLIRKKEVLDFIRSRTGLKTVPRYVKIELEGNSTILNVPVYTDIKNPEFLSRFQRLVEAKWTRKVGDRWMKVKVNLQLMDFGTKTPALGEKIDIEKHALLFPTDGGVLTTGAEYTRCYFYRVCALGPQDIAENTLAHEFGHLLGFDDAYFRGYRELGADGYELFEVGSDSSDIMSDPGQGRVQDFHFLTLIQALRN